MGKYRVRQVNPSEYVVEGFIYSHTDEGVEIWNWLPIDKWGSVCNCVLATCIFTDLRKAKQMAEFKATDEQDNIIFEIGE